MRAFQRKRLLKLADHLDIVPNRKFDLACWDCGTTACAMGYACRMPSFNKAGLRLGKLTATPYYKNWAGFEAAQKFFGLGQVEALTLFSPSYNPLGYKATPKGIAKQIRQLVADKTTV